MERRTCGRGRVGVPKGEEERKSVTHRSSPPLVVEMDTLQAKGSQRGPWVMETRVCAVFDGALIVRGD